LRGRALSLGEGVPSPSPPTTPGTSSRRQARRMVSGAPPVLHLPLRRPGALPPATCSPPVSILQKNCNPQSSGKSRVSMVVPSSTLSPTRSDAGTALMTGACSRAPCVKMGVSRSQGECGQASARQWRALRGCGLVFSIGQCSNTAAGHNSLGTFIAGTGGCMFFLFNAIVLRPPC
jgi:hypothetical protein